MLNINKIKKIIQNDAKRRRMIELEKKYYENDNIIKAKGLLPSALLIGSVSDGNIPFAFIILSFS